MTGKKHNKDQEKVEERSDKHPLQFNVAQLLKHPGSDSRSYPIKDVTIPSLNKEFLFAAPFNGQIKLIKTDKEILVLGNLNTELILPCTRCLTDVKAPYQLEIEEIFSPTVDITTGSYLPRDDDADEATLISEQHILDLAEVVRQSILLNEPTQVTCREDCKGLCSQCGANLNEESCNCVNDMLDSRWADLAKIKDNFS